MCAVWVGFGWGTVWGQLDAGVSNGASVLDWADDMAHGTVEMRWKDGQVRNFLNNLY